MTDELKHRLELLVPRPGDDEIEAALRSITRQARRQRRTLAAVGIAAATTTVLGAVALLDRDPGHERDVTTEPESAAPAQTGPPADCETKTTTTTTTTTSTTLGTPGGPLYSAWDLREYLRTTVGDVVGGVHGDETTDTLIIGVLPGGRPAVEAAKRDFDATSPVPSPPVRYVEAANSLNRLDTLNARALSAWDQFQDAGGPQINSLGIDDPSNTVAVGLQENTPANQAAILDAICAAPSEVSFTQEDAVAAL
jgi:hypothetical protein